MWPFKDVPAPELELTPKPMTFQHYAGVHLGISSGLQVMFTQVRNENLRHCRIGKIVLKRA